MSRLQAGLALALAIVFLVWPVVHLVWSLGFGLNSWKLAGWGMYASIDPLNVGLNVLTLAADQPIGDLQIGRVLGPPRIIAASPTAGRDLDQGTLSEGQRRQLRELFTKIRVLRRKSDVQALARSVREISSRPADAVLVLVSVPRLDVFQRITYTETEFYLVPSGGRARSLGTYSSERLSEHEILERVEKQASRELLSLGARGPESLSAL